MSVVGQAVLSAFLKVLFDRLASPELLKFARQEQVYTQLKKWEKILHKIHAVLNDAEDRQMTDQFVKIWLGELRDLAYDVEDVLDEFDTEALRRKLITKPQPSTTQVQIFISSCSSLMPSNARFKFRMGSKIKGITARLQEISAQKNDLDLRENSSGGRSNRVRERLPTTSLVNEAQVLGREKDREVVLELLLRDFESYGDPASVIAIVGMGGVGKTTLAQLVYNDDKVKDWFDLKVWACVSDDFDVLRVTKTILESVVVPVSLIGSNLNLLQVRLQDVLKDKKFLLVLDDVWNENYHNWDVLCRPFRCGAPGSKIVVTTRNEGVASIMGTVASYHLKELSYDSCLPLFTQLALGTNNFDAYPNLKVIGEEIVKKCKGLPLAAKTLGSLLRTKVGQNEWEDILHSKIWDLPEEQSGILPALRLSYHHLPSHLKRCFAYCAIFPKDYEFNKDELVLLWMAEGFLQQSKGTNRMEKLGGKYFDDLLSRSFFQRSSGSELQFVMHDLINDLAQYVAGEICFGLEETLESSDHHKILGKARYASHIRRRYEVFNKFEVLYKAPCLRTFITLPVHLEISWQNFYLSRKVICDLLPKLRHLRALSLSGYCITELPNSIGKLKHLRYLNLSHTLIKELPESVSTLCNLQTLMLHSCGALCKLPAGLGNLINLRHLDISNTRQLQEMPLHIGKLKSLRTLSKFIVGKTSGLGITELRDLLRLRGTLTILGLHNVTNILDAEQANLRYKQDLEELVMEWCNGSIDELQNERDDMLEIDVLDMLQPHKSLKILKIACYGGTKFPSWVGDSSFSKLVHLTLRNCINCSSLPPIGRLPLLEDLCIQGMKGIKSVGLEFYGDDSPSFKPFPSLKTLTFSDMLEWEDWSSTMAEESVESEFPSLRELHIGNCPKLIKRLPNHLPSLVNLDICKCPLFAVQLPILPSLCDLNLEECNEVVLRSIHDLTSLTNLQLKGIPKVRNMPAGLTLGSATLKVMNVISCGELTSLRQIGCQVLPCSLEHLELYNCSTLEKLPDELFSLTSLANLKMKRCPKLSSFPETGLPSMLRYLVIEECEALKSLPNGMMVDGNNTGGRSSESGKISCLEGLEIIKCSSLTSFPRGKLPPTLKVLKIWDCTALESLSELILRTNTPLECLSIRKYTNLKTLPECLTCLTNLIELHVSYCAGFESFPETGLPTSKLRRFYIFNCANLKSLPNEFRNLTSLQHMGISSCPSLVSFPEGGLPSNLISLRINNCENLPPLSEWGLHRLISLKDFAISGGCPGLVSFAYDHQLPSTLIHLRIGKLLSLESLSVGFQTLTLLEVLEITECPKLQSLPKEGLPATLQVLEISECPILKRRCSKAKGKYWPKIAHIPRVEIDEVLQQ